MTTTTATPGPSRNASPYLYGEDAVAVAQMLETGQYGHTGVTEELERRIAEFLGVRAGWRIAACAGLP